MKHWAPLKRTQMSSQVPMGRPYVSPGWSEAATGQSETLGSIGTIAKAPNGATLLKAVESRAVRLGNAVRNFFYLISKGSGVAAFVRTWMEALTLHILTTVATQNL